MLHVRVSSFACLWAVVTTLAWYATHRDRRAG